jgi:hypothetical protein
VAALAARAGVRGILVNDAGIGRDEAGIGGLAFLDALGIPAAAIDAFSARIGDAADMLARGRVSRANGAAAILGVTSGQSAAGVVDLMSAAPASSRPGQDEPKSSHRMALSVLGGRVVLLDSVGEIEAGDEGACLVTGSHAGLPENALGRAVPVTPALLVLNDAGLGIEEAGVRALSPLARRGVAAVAVAASSARIGDGRSTWEDGILSRVNALAASSGLSAGQRVPEAIRSLLKARPAHPRPAPARSPQEAIP